MMLKLADIRNYIVSLGIAEDSHVYIGKLDNKQEKSIGVYHRKGDGPPLTALGGIDCSSYDVRRLSLLIHWARNASASEEAAYQLYEALRCKKDITIGNHDIRFLILQTPEPVDIGTDDNGVYEYVIWVDLIYSRST